MKKLRQMLQTRAKNFEQRLYARLRENFVEVLHTTSCHGGTSGRWLITSIEGHAWTELSFELRKKLMSELVDEAASEGIDLKIQPDGVSCQDNTTNRLQYWLFDFGEEHDADNDAG